MANRKKPAAPRRRKAPAVRKASTAPKTSAARKRKVLRIRTARQVRALRAPLRQEIVQAFTKLGACTVRELADELGHEPASLYYHVHGLEEAGIVLEVDRRKDGGRPESVYAPVAERIIIDRTETSKAFLSALSDLQCSTLRAAERELAASIAAAGRAGKQDPTTLLRLEARLKPRDQARARKMLREVVEFLAESDDATAEDTFSLTVAMVRLAK